MKCPGRWRIVVPLFLASVLAVDRVTLASQGPGAAQADAGVAREAKRRDANAVRALVRKHADVNAAEADGTTALHWAIRNDDLDTFGVLMDAGAKVDAANRYGITPLWLANVGGNAAFVERLLTAGADVNTTRGDSGETVLMIAARSGHGRLVRMLLSKGATINAAEKVRRQSALIWAAAEGHPDVVQMLLEAGADPHARTTTGMTALMFSIRRGDIEATRRLLDAGARLTDTASDGTSMLVLAILNARFELAALLLDRGADPNVKDPNGYPLHVLAFLRRANNRGLSDIIPRVPSGALDSIDLAKALLAHGANVNQPLDWVDKQTHYRLGVTMPITIPQHMAIGTYMVSFAGGTPFYIAAAMCDVPFMRFLAANGADPTRGTKQRVTPLLAAAGIGFREGENPGTHTEALEAVQLTYELGNDPRAVVAFGDYTVGDASWDGATALHGAANRGATDLVRWLIEKGVPLDAKTNRGMLPFNYANGTAGGLFHFWADTTALIRQAMLDLGMAIPPPPAPGP